MRPTAGHHCTSTLSYCTPLIFPPRIEFFTLCRNWSRFFRSSSAASKVGLRLQRSQLYVLALETYPCSVDHLHSAPGRDIEARPRQSSNSTPASNLHGEYSSRHSLLDQRLDGISTEQVAQQFQWSIERRTGTHCLCTLDLWRLMGVICVDVHGEKKCAPLVHALSNVHITLFTVTDPEEGTHLHQE